MKPPTEGSVVASVSGGKDSVAMSLALTEAGIDHVRVFADTGWEHESTYEHLEYLRGVLGPIETVRGKREFVGMVRSHGMFPSRKRIAGGRNARFCTTDLKVLPLTKLMVSMADDVVNAVGIRAAESKARANLPETEENESTGITVWRPILRWTREEVIAIHERHGVRLHSLYHRGATRIGCWPCIYSSKAELRLVADIDPDRIRLIRELEEELSEGKETPRSMFGLRPDGHKYEPATIDEVIDWARQVRGTYLMDLPGDDWPCASYGFCETP